MISASPLLSVSQIDCTDQGVVERRFAAYDAIASKGDRKTPRVTTMSEDNQLDAKSRQKLTATNRDVVRNFVLASWMCRKHLDYTTSFTFRAKTSDEVFNTQLEKWVAKNWAARDKFHAGGRHRLQRFLRIAEGRRVLDGDFGILKLAGTNQSTRGRVQGIEGDLITTGPMDGLPRTFNQESWTSGVRLSRGGRSQEYCLARRADKTGKVFDRIVPASSMLLHAYFDSSLRHDQVRGISPLAAAINTLQDTYEGFTYSLARIKVAQMFGMTIYRDAEAAMAPVTPTVDTDGDGDADANYDIDFGRGPILLDLDAGDKAEFLENKTPAIETTKFLELMILVSLKALDIPYSMWNESFTNFYGSRGGLIQYLKASKPKIADNRELLDDLTRWRLGMAVGDGDLQLPRGTLFEDLSWEWIHDGVPWWDPVKEVTGAGMSVAAGFQTFDQVVRQSGGGDVYDNIRDNAAVMKYAQEQGFPLTLPGVDANSFTMEPEDES